MVINFTKMHGAANDFIMIDDRTGVIPWEDYVLMSLLASRRTGVGCEGIILIQSSTRADFRMRFLNPDGTEVDMCGNGARCAVWFAYKIGAAKARSITMETSCGLLDAEIIGDGMVKVWMPEPTARSYGVKLTTEHTTYTGDYLNTGVPHFVVFCDKPECINVQTEGQALRLHDTFSPEGANIDFVKLRMPNRITMRTYERGVEDESGACGTGAVAAAVCAVEKHCATLPIRIRTSADFELVVDADWRNHMCTGVTLTGPVREVYSGTIDLNDLDLSSI